MSKFGFYSIFCEQIDRMRPDFCIIIIIDKILVGIVNGCFLQICNRVTALDSCQNLVLTQYLENELKK